ncbi:transformer-2 sex-determining protein-like [Teleopsis dalmanni]|uniref:transformer-2 sex-determining protein-like n=1 Tax=Teleopsis dalmanni TaxID=139649 RepID=UPI0018CE2C03|nr:transformer-2 sex-determining protein-like [Teleopsis dalmanni]XP_037944860.1 transformer-2 sex-determining protein-like [Teleopsis dalmanni]
MTRSRSRSRSQVRKAPRKRRSVSSNSSRSRKNEYHSTRARYSRSPVRVANSRDKYDRVPKPNPCIGVFGLSTFTTQFKIREIFSKFGKIKQIQVVTDQMSGRSKGFCFIYYGSIGDACEARNTCNGIEIDGRRIRVDYAFDQRDANKSNSSTSDQRKKWRDNSPPVYESNNYRGRDRDRERNHDRERERDREVFVDNGRDSERNRHRETDRKRNYEQSRKHDYDSGRSQQYRSTSHSSRDYYRK